MIGLNLGVPSSAIIIGLALAEFFYRVSSHGFGSPAVFKLYRRALVVALFSNNHHCIGDHVNFGHGMVLFEALALDQRHSWLRSLQPHINLTS